MLKLDAAETKSKFSSFATDLKRGIDSLNDEINAYQYSRAQTYAQLSELNQKASYNSMNTTNLQDSVM